MKMQACYFRRTRDSNQERGVAILDTFDYSNVISIIGEDAKPVGEEVYDYNLIRGPMAYLDTRAVDVL